MDTITRDSLTASAEACETAARAVLETITADTPDHVVNRLQSAIDGLRGWAVMDRRMLEPPMSREQIDAFLAELGFEEPVAEVKACTCLGIQCYCGKDAPEIAFDAPAKSWTSEADFERKVDAFAEAELTNWPTGKHVSEKLKHEPRCGACTKVQSEEGVSGKCAEWHTPPRHAVGVPAPLPVGTKVYVDEGTPDGWDYEAVVLDFVDDTYTLRTPDSKVHSVHKDYVEEV